LKRRAWRTVLDHVYQALVRWLAPVLVFTAEEAWGSRYPDAGSVHLLEWPVIGTWQDEALAARIGAVRRARELAYLELEALRRDKRLGSFLEAGVVIETEEPGFRTLLEGLDLAELLLVASVEVREGSGLRVEAVPSGLAKCERCWRHLPDVDGETGLCGRCDGVVNG
jgi:isoleucyl-tRNA synthetase